MNYKIGSFWRRWDLHVHTPFSSLNNGFGDPFGANKDSVINKYVHEIFSKAIDKKIITIGITDYFSIEGYKEVKEVLKNETRLTEIFGDELKSDSKYLDKVKAILVLPNIEFRLSQIVSVDKKDSKLQIHLILSNDLKTSDIETNLLNVLPIRYNNMHGVKNYYCTRNSITQFGKNCRENGIGDLTKSDAFIGMEEASVDFNDLLKCLNDSTFKNKFLLVGVEEDITKIEWSSQAGIVRKNIYSACNAMFSSNRKTINWCNSEDAEKTIGERKPCLWGSDSHDFKNLFCNTNNSFCWIKADNTFLGLIEATYSFENRIFIGEEPLELISIKQRKLYTLEEVDCDAINKNGGDKWFDFSLKINPIMTTIIGNKGSGKSALTDIISLCGSSNHMDKVSFLNEDRFKKGSSNFASRYRAWIKFFGSPDQFCVSSLNDDNSLAINRVEYLPQRYIEDVCTDVDNGFQTEINNVLYSFVQPAERDNTSNLDELIAKKTKTIESDLIQLRGRLSSENLLIRELERKSDDNYKKEVEKRLEEQKIRRDNWLQNKPDEVKKPSNLEDDSISKEILKIDQSIKAFEDQLVIESQSLIKLNSQIEDLNKLVNDINNANTNIGNINDEMSSYLLKYSLDFHFVYTVKSDLDGLNAHIKHVNDEARKFRLETTKTFLENYSFGESFQSSDLENLLSKEASIPNKIVILKAYRSRLEAHANDANTNYLKYLSKFKEWKKTLDMIEGKIPDEDGKGSIKKATDELDYLNDSLMEDLEKNYKLRLETIESIYMKIIDKKNILFDIYFPIQTKLDSILKNNDEKIAFNVTISSSDSLLDNLIGKINQSVTSKYRGIEDGKKELFKEINNTEFNEQESTIHFVDTLLKNVSFSKEKIDILLKNDSISFYNFVGGLEFLDAKFTLTMGEKQLKELSPGERGIVLLIFYLALSSNNVPLIIDQPEDNLDNQSIFTKLVPCIKEAKKNRQIIIVTHNPNIAIACDSEQIICCSMDKTTNEITYNSGSIENPEIKKNIIDILEGTQIAFDYRKLKYEGK